VEAALERLLESSQLQQPVGAGFGVAELATPIWDA
jgi:hypothetical protein